jgi:hypothetical protein
VAPEDIAGAAEVSGESFSGTESRKSADVARMRTDDRYRDLD